MYSQDINFEVFMKENDMYRNALKGLFNIYIALYYHIYGLVELNNIEMVSNLAGYINFDEIDKQAILYL